MAEIVMELPEEPETTEVLDEFEMAFKEIDQSNASNEEKITRFSQLLTNPRLDDYANKIKEQSIYRLVNLFSVNQDFQSILSLLKTNSDFFNTIPKAKTAKIVRNILDILATIPDSLSLQIQFCRDVVEWCKLEKRTFLRQRVESKLAGLLLQAREFQTALKLISTLLIELRKLDDKQLLTEAHLIESRILHSLLNLPKAKASLTSCRTAAHAIYVSPLLQAEIDEMSGVLYCEDSDPTTALSYFLEAYDAYDQNKGDDGKKLISSSSSSSSSSVSQSPSFLSAQRCLCYMALCKILIGSGNEVTSLLSSPSASKYSGVPTQALLSLAQASVSRSLSLFTQASQQYSSYLSADPLLSHHLSRLSDRMLEDNLLKIILPYSCVELSFISSKISLPTPQVERKLSQMILDKRVIGVLDQGRGQLIIYEGEGNDTQRGGIGGGMGGAGGKKKKGDSSVGAGKSTGLGGKKSYGHGMEVISSLSEVVTLLTSQAKVLSIHSASTAAAGVSTASTTDGKSSKELKSSSSSSEKK